MNSIIFKRLKKLYESGQATDTTILNAVEREWITRKQYTEITGKELEPEEEITQAQ